MQLLMYDVIIINIMYICTDRKITNTTNTIADIYRKMKPHGMVAKGNAIKAAIILLLLSYYLLPTESTQVIFQGSRFSKYFEEFI